MGGVNNNAPPRDWAKLAAGTDRLTYSSPNADPVPYGAAMAEQALDKANKNVDARGWIRSLGQTTTIDATELEAAVTTLSRINAGSAADDDGKLMGFVHLQKLVDDSKGGGGKYRFKDPEKPLERAWNNCVTADGERAVELLVADQSMKPTRKLHYLYQLSQALNRVRQDLPKDQVEKITSAVNGANDALLPVAETEAKKSSSWLK